MLFIWTSEGGPLQYIGLGLFLLQLAPHLLPEIIRQVNQQSSLAMGVAVGILAAAVWQMRNIDTSAIRRRLEQSLEAARARLEAAIGRDWHYTTVPALLGVALAVMVTLISRLGILVGLQVIGQVMTIISFFEAGRRQTQQGPPDAPSREAKLEEMSALVRSMPLEPFLSEEEMVTAPISQLKQMLERRGTKKEELDSFLERQNLVEALQKKRKYSDTCCICFEDHVKEEPMRILPNCCHELHVECLDKWVYTFANNPIKRQQDPTCPLCKVVMKANK